MYIIIPSQSPQHLQNVMQTLLTNVKSFPSPLTIVPLLGISFDVMIRLKAVKDEIVTHLSPEVKVMHSHLVINSSMTII